MAENLESRFEEALGFLANVPVTYIRTSLEFGAEGAEAALGALRTLEGPLRFWEDDTLDDCLGRIFGFEVAVAEDGSVEVLGFMGQCYGESRFDRTCAQVLDVLAPFARKCDVRLCSENDPDCAIGFLSPEVPGGPCRHAVGHLAWEVIEGH